MLMNHSKIMGFTVLPYSQYQSSPVPDLLSVGSDLNPPRPTSLGRLAPLPSVGTAAATGRPPESHYQ